MGSHTCYQMVTALLEQSSAEVGLDEVWIPGGICQLRGAHLARRADPALGYSVETDSLMVSCSSLFFCRYSPILL